MLARLKHAARRNPALLRAVRSSYPALSWISNRPQVYRRVAPFLDQAQFDEVRLSGRGNEPEAHLRRTRRMLDLATADVLVLGCGRGDELALWQDQRPRTLTATDFFAHCPDWDQHAGIRFAQMDVRALGFADDSFDLLASTALLEHVDGVEVLAAEMARVTRPGGVVFANFGPLWHAYGGAHYCGAYEHLWMDDPELERYLVARSIPAEMDDGLLWLRNGMFSRLRYDEYIEIFRRHFDIDHVTLGVSKPGLRYRRTHPDEWRALTSRYAERDLLTFSATVWMRPLKAVFAASAQPPQVRLSA